MDSVAGEGSDNMRRENLKGVIGECGDNLWLESLKGRCDWRVWRQTLAGESEGTV